jgi:hypothetical protein
MINFLLLAMHLQTRLTGLCSILIYAVKHDCVFGVDDLRIDEIELVSQVPCSCFLAIQFHLGNTPFNGKDAIVAIPGQVDHPAVKGQVARCANVSPSSLSQFFHIPWLNIGLCKDCTHSTPYM